MLVALKMLTLDGSISSLLNLSPDPFSRNQAVKKTKHRELQNVAVTKWDN